ncbi:MAG: fructose bisphosphate aldolase [Cellvibrionales bacterium]|nr:fructose bisphosphate aldolase [Cellvibrionales bacterium]
MNQQTEDREQQRERIASGQGFIAALDQSGGSTRAALERYGIQRISQGEDAVMFIMAHHMRIRIVASPAFDHRILGAILFRDTMNREIQGKPSAQFLWQVKQVVPFLKVDQGLAEEADGVQLMRPMPDLKDLLKQARKHGMFGTKMRSVIKASTEPNEAAIAAVVDQQFEVARKILAAGLTPIIEPEVDIYSPYKKRAEKLLRKHLLKALDALHSGPKAQQVMLKLTLPQTPGFHAPLVKHPAVLRVLALSGGYPQENAIIRLSQNPGVIASFSRALTERLSIAQRDPEFDSVLDAAIEAIYQASNT